MRYGLKLLLSLFVVLSGVAMGQQVFVVRPSTTFPVRLYKTIDAAHVQPGDPVEFRTVEPILLGQGVIVPDNSALIGEVVSSSPGDAAHPHSTMQIRLYTLRWNSGEAHLNAIVTRKDFVPSASMSKFQGPRKPTFLEHIDISNLQSSMAVIQFDSDSKNIVLRKDIRLDVMNLSNPGTSRASVEPPK